MHRSHWLRSLVNRPKTHSRKQRRHATRAAEVSWRGVEVLEERVLLSADPLGPEELVNTNPSGVQQVGTYGRQAVAVGPDDSYVVVWGSSEGDGSMYGVFARRFAADGSPLSGEFLVNTTTANNQQDPAVAMAADGRFVITWGSFQQDGSGWGIYARVFAANGSPLTGEIAVNQTTFNNQQTSSVAMLDGGGFVVAWAGNGAGDASGIFARVFSGTGTAMSSEILVNQTTANSQLNPAVVSDGAGGFAVVWYGQGTGDSSGVFFRRFNSTGTPLTGETLVNQTTAGSQSYPSITLMEDGTFVVAWSGRGTGDTSGIYARRLSAAGTALGDEILVNQVTSGTQEAPSVAASGSGFAVTWMGYGSDDEEAGVFLRLFNADGTAAGDQQLVNQSINGTQRRPSVAAQSAGLVVVWSGPGVGDAFGTFARRYSTGVVPNLFADAPDANPGDGIIADASGNFTLRAAIMEANAQNLPDVFTINLEAGTYALEIAGRDEDAAETGDLDVTAIIEIIGAGTGLTFIDGELIDRVFHVLAGATLILRDLTITGGDAANSGLPGGGGVLAENANLVIDNVVFMENRAFSDVSDFGGGAVAMVGGTATITDSIFTQNVTVSSGPPVHGAGGAVVAVEGADLTITGSQFQDNTADVGGAIFVADSTFTLSDTTISANRATGNGGGINVQMSAVTITNIDVNSNLAEKQGGGLWNFGSVITIDDSTFVDNVANDSGGGIENTGRITAAIGTITLTNSTVSGNVALNGGGIMNRRDSVLDISDSSIVNNTAAESGGGIANVNTESFGPGLVTLTNIDLSGNSAGLHGGGLFAVKNSTEVYNSTITNNTAEQGGGLKNIEGGEMLVSGSLIAGNSTTNEGGGLQNELSTLTVLNSTITDNHVTNDGGGLFNFAGVVNISGSTFSNNSADSTGGGIENTGRITAAIGVMTITDTVITGNSAYDGGGVQNKRDSLLTIIDSFITNNTASNSGGGVANQNTEIFGPGTVTIERTEISGNSAGYYGGGLWAIKNTTNIIDSTVANNTAHEGGGLANIDYGTMTVAGSLITGNSTDNEGGGIQNEIATLTVVDSTISDNSVGNDGGGIFNFAGWVEVNGATISGNTAVSSGGGIENTGKPGVYGIGELTVINSTFSDNHAYEGGGLMNRRQGSVSVSGSTFTGNTALLGGGGLGNTEGSTLDISDSLITGNAALGDGTQPFGGGGVATLSGTLTITDTTISNNTAEAEPGATYYGFGAGVVAVQGAQVTITGSSLINNAADGGGGLFHNEGSVVEIADSLISGNHANGTGGGLKTELSTLNITNSVISNNSSGGDGGGLGNFASVVTISDSVISGNSTDRSGGGIENTGRVTAAIGTITITRSTISGNTAGLDGGGVRNYRDSILTITHSTISDNEAGTNGGGVASTGTGSFSGAVTTIYNTTISGNTAAGNGGGISNVMHNNVIVVNATITNNEATIGGGMYNDTDVVAATNSIVAGNTATSADPDVSGTFVSGGHNLIGIIGSGIGFTNGVNGDIVGTSASPVDPLLSPLQDNGGPTLTHALLAGSPAIDAGDNDAVSDPGTATDQRGAPRIADGDGNGSAIVDIGAVEFGSEVPLDALFAGSLLGELLNGA